jgi:ubiquinone/menaquinone biosynthesis C-methylase UbiE
VAGERALDLATGTGNAALLVARRGASATGVDAAQRLLEVGRERAARERLEVEFLLGDLLEPPVPARAFELVLSNFGVIFAADPARALDAIAKALAPGGRVLLTAWVPQGPISAILGVFAQAVDSATGAERAERFPWHEPQAVGELAGPYGASVSAHEEQLEFTAASARDFLDEGERDHPLAPARRKLLERAETYAATYEEALAVLEQANEDPAGFRVRSPYRVLELRDFGSA